MRITSPFRNFGVLFARVCLLLMVCVMRAGSAGQIDNGGAKVFIDFNDDTDGNITLTGALLNLPTPTLNGLAVAVTINGVNFSYTLNAAGQAANTNDLFDLRIDRPVTNSTSNLSFTFNAQAAGLAAAFANVGLTNSSLTNQTVSIDVSVTLGSTAYTATLSGLYDDTDGKNGTAYVGTIQPPSNPAKPTLHVKSFLGTPNPAAANQGISFQSALTQKGLTGSVQGFVYFGDGSAPVRGSDKTFTQLLAHGVPHAYSTEACYVARLVLIADNDVVVVRLFVVVGSAFACNARQRLNVITTYIGGQYFFFTLDVDSVPGAADAITNFYDLNRNTFQHPRAVDPRAAVTGLTFGKDFTSFGLFIAETMALDANDVPIVPTTLLRKTVSVGKNNVNARDSASPRDENTDETITLASMKAKFDFSASKLDTVVFTGTLPLPAGYAPKNPSGNDIPVSMGNVIDSVHLDAKGRLTLPTAKGLIKVFKLTPPKLPTGVAAGGETAKVSFTMTSLGLSALGFDSEGITSTVRSDELGMTGVQRFVQVNMVIDNTTYSVLAPVQFTVDTSGDFGTFQGRR